VSAALVIVDGNNLLHAWRSKPAHVRDFGAGRWALVRHLDRLAGDIGSAILIVFDGTVGGRDEGLSHASVEVIYARADVSADLVIERRVRAAADPSTILVVTSDRAIQRVAGAAGAEIMGCESFFEWAEDRARQLSASLRRPRKPNQRPRLGDFFPP